MTSLAPFDRIAGSYDTLWTKSDVGRAQREAVWRVIDRMFQPGDKVLDVGCGTGEDAVHLGHRRIHVSAIDASGEMVRMASSRGVAATQLAAEELDRIRATYDGALSDFGVLNCTANLPMIASSLARLVRPGGYAAICLLNRTCAWEIAWFGLRLHVRTALRRMRRGGVLSSLGLWVHYPSAREVRRAFEPAFELVQSRGVGVFVPPSYVSLPTRMVRLTVEADALLGGLAMLRTLGDHRLYVFRRRPAC
ncbi:MAG: methyltransferase domain-containing protein [Bryobacteraceae bacterium]|jgi:ubiquinone/menaquinone biosynthesis C-methylase UbiE